MNADQPCMPLVLTFKTELAFPNSVRSVPLCVVRRQCFSLCTRH